LQAVKAGKFEDRYENALVELLNKKRKGEPVRMAETGRLARRRTPN
jgi:non-homologous end joining protein Ku